MPLGGGVLVTRLSSVVIPLNPDAYTDLAIAKTNGTILTNFKGALDVNGQAAASFNVPANLPPLADFTVYHAYVVFDAQGVSYLCRFALPLSQCDLLKRVSESQYQHGNPAIPRYQRYGSMPEARIRGVLIQLGVLGGQVKGRISTECYHLLASLRDPPLPTFPT